MYWKINKSDGRPQDAIFVTNCTEVEARQVGAEVYGYLDVDALEASEWEGEPPVSGGLNNEHLKRRGWVPNS